MRGDPRRICFYHWQINDSIFRVCRRRAVWRAQHIRQVAQPEDLIELFFLFNDCAEESWLLSQPFFECPDTDCNEDLAPVWQDGVYFRAGGQVLPHLTRSGYLFTTLSQ